MFVPQANPTPQLLQGEQLPSLLGLGMGEMSEQERDVACTYPSLSISLCGER